MSPKRSLVILLSIVFVATLAGLGARFAIAQFTEPSTTPPGDNPLPIWVSLPNGNIYHTTGGNVGIGTTSPIFKLDVSTSGTAIRAESTGTATGVYGVGYTAGVWGKGSQVYGVFGQGGQYGIYGTGYYGVRGESTDAAGYAFYGNGRSYFGGNVGIGTTGPAAKLHVRGGNAYIDNINFGGTPSIALAVGDTDTGLHSTADGALDIYSDNVNAMSIRGGNVGIGNRSPRAKLDVVGNILAYRIAIQEYLGSLGLVGDWCPGGGICNPRPDSAVVDGAGKSCSVSERGQIALVTAETAQNYSQRVITDGLYFCACGSTNFDSNVECRWIGVLSVPTDGNPPL